MSIPIAIPRLGWNMEEGTFLEWRKRNGDLIRPGDVLYVIESEKAAEEIETLDGGILGIPASAPQPGDKVQVGQVIAHLLAQGETIAEQDPAPARKDRSLAAPVLPPAASPSARRLARQMGVDLVQLTSSGLGTIGEKVVRARSTVEAPDRAPARTELESRPAAPANRRRIAISPRARRVARELGVDWQELSGSGSSGRIRERDIRGASGQVAAGRLIPHTPVRLAIAARMVASVTQAAPVTLYMRVDADMLVGQRERLKAASFGEPVPTYTDMLVKVVAGELRRQPLLHAQWRDKGLFLPERIAIAFAVDTEYGLFAPVIRDPDRLTLADIAHKSSALTARARAGKLSADDLRDATFTVTNLGMHGVEEFTPIITPPQCAVLGLGRIARMPAIVGNAVMARHQLPLSLTFDHRIVDGAPAARFLDSVRDVVEKQSEARL